MAGEVSNGVHKGLAEEGGDDFEEIETMMRPNVLVMPGQFVPALLLKN